MRETLLKTLLGQHLSNWVWESPQLIRISRERLLRLCHDYPEIGFQIMHRMAAELALKLRSSNRGIRDQLFAKKTEDQEDF